MHELSITSSVVDAVTESLRAYPGAKVLEVRLRVGALAAVVEDSLQFCWGIATEGTELAGSRLVVNCGSGDGALRGVRRGWGTGEFAGLPLSQAAASRPATCAAGGSWRLSRSRLRMRRRK